jgi:hypothetical protein
MKNFVQKITLFFCLFGFITTPSERKSVSIAIDYPLLKLFPTFKLYREPRQNIIAIESNVDFVNEFYTKAEKANQKINQFIEQANQYFNNVQEQNHSEEQIAQIKMNLHQKFEQEHQQNINFVQLATLFPYQPNLYKRITQINNAFQQKNQMNQSTDENKLLLINLNTWPQIYQQFAKQLAQENEKVPELFEKINNQITKITNRGYSSTELLFNRYDDYFLLYFTITTLITQLFHKITFPKPNQATLARLKPETKSFLQKWQNVLIAGAGTLFIASIGLFAAKSGVFGDLPQQFAETVFEKGTELGTQVVEKTTELGEQTLEKGKDIGRQTISGELIKKGGGFLWEHKQAIATGGLMSGVSAVAMPILSGLTPYYSEKKPVPTPSKAEVLKTLKVFGGSFAQGAATTALNIAATPMIIAKLGNLKPILEKSKMMQKLLSNPLFKNQLIQHYLTTGVTKATQNVISRGIGVALSKETTTKKLGAIAKSAASGMIPQPDYFINTYASLPFDPTYVERAADVTLRSWVLYKSPQFQFLKNMYQFMLKSIN